MGNINGIFFIVGNAGFISSTVWVPTPISIREVRDSCNVAKYSREYMQKQQQTPMLET